MLALKFLDQLKFSALDVADESLTIEVPILLALSISYILHITLETCRMNKVDYWSMYQLDSDWKTLGVTGVKSPSFTYFAPLPCRIAGDR